MAMHCSSDMDLISALDTSSQQHQLMSAWLHQRAQDTWFVVNMKQVVEFQ